MWTRAHQGDLCTLTAQGNSCSPGSSSKLCLPFPARGCLCGSRLGSQSRYGPAAEKASKGAFAGGCTGPVDAASGSLSESSSSILACRAASRVLADLAVPNLQDGSPETHSTRLVGPIEESPFLSAGSLLHKVRELGQDGLAEDVMSGGSEVPRRPKTAKHAGVAPE